MRRWLKATLNSWHGLRDAVRSEAAVREELLALILAVPLAFVREWIAIVIYIAVALFWLVPDRRIETAWK